MTTIQEQQDVVCAATLELYRLEKLHLHIRLSSSQVLQDMAE